MGTRADRSGHRWTHLLHLLHDLQITRPVVNATDLYVLLLDFR